MNDLHSARRLKQDRLGSCAGRQAQAGQARLLQWDISQINRDQNLRSKPTYARGVDGQEQVSEPPQRYVVQLRAESSTLSSFSLFLCEPLRAGSAVHLSLARRERGAW